MNEDRCTLFTFLTGNAFAAVLHFLCALSGWCCLVFPILPLFLFLLERNSAARRACLHTGIISLAAAALEFVPVMLWLIIRAATHASGAFYVICTILFVGVMAILFFLLLAIEVTCGIRSIRNEEAEVPFISAWVEKLANRL